MTTLSATEFLSHIWPQKLLTHETIELRVIDRKTKKIKREFISGENHIQKFLGKAERYRNFEVYFGVSTRFGNQGKKQDCYRLCTVWADLDKKNLSYLKNLSPFKPDIVVESGGGLHAYWLLKQKPLLIRGTDPKTEAIPRVDYIESITRGLCKRFGGDITTADVSRILRVPDGFFNHKYSPAKEVKAYLV
jgi:hypothetical protein